MSENTASLAAGHGIVHTINFGLWDLACIGGCGATIGLVIMMFFTAKSERYKAFGKITFLVEFSVSMNHLSLVYHLC